MSIRSTVISRLTGNRELTTDELAELDSLAVALELNENDPYWAQVGWIWAVTPRKEWIDIAHRALAAEIRHDIADRINQQPPSGEPGTQLEAIQKKLDELAARPVPSGVAIQVDYAEIKAAIQTGFAGQKKGVVSSDAVFDAIKSAARETFGWILVAAAAGLIGLSLFLGTQFGEYLQSGKIQDLEKQVSDLSAALAKK